MIVGGSGLLARLQSAPPSCAFKLYTSFTDDCMLQAAAPRPGPPTLQRRRSRLQFPSVPPAASRPTRPPRRPETKCRRSSCGSSRPAAAARPATPVALAVMLQAAAAEHRRAASDVAWAGRRPPTGLWPPTPCPSSAPAARPLQAATGAPAAPERQGHFTQARAEASAARRNCGGQGADPPGKDGAGGTSRSCTAPLRTRSGVCSSSWVSGC